MHFCNPVVAIGPKMELAQDYARSD
jgi:hypothetical protein